MKKLNEEWYIVENKKLIFRRNGLFETLFFWFYRIKLEELYSITQSYLNKPECGELVNIFERDQFIKPQQYPRAYRILNGWHIKQDSLKFIKDGPLISEG